MPQTSPQQLTKLVAEFPALKGLVDTVRHDGIPMTVRVEVQRADAEFIGFRPMDVDGPTHWPARAGMIGSLKQVVIPVRGDSHTLMERFRPGSQMYGSIRDLLRCHGPDFYAYFVVVTDIDWHGLVPETALARTSDPRGAILKVERRIVVRTAPKAGGFARLLDTASQGHDLYFCIEADEFRRRFPYHYRHLADGFNTVRPSLIAFFRSLDHSSHRSQTGERSGVTYVWHQISAISSVVSDIRLTMKNNDALVEIVISRVHATVTAFHGTIGNVLLLIRQFIAD